MLKNSKFAFLILAITPISAPADANVCDEMSEIVSSSESGFSSIIGNVVRRRSEINTYSSSYMMPGASECEIREYVSLGSRRVIECFWNYGNDRNGAVSAYAGLVGSVAECNGFTLHDDDRSDPTLYEARLRASNSPRSSIRIGYIWMPDWNEGVVSVEVTTR